MTERSGGARLGAPTVGVSQGRARPPPIRWPLIGPKRNRVSASRDLAEVSDPRRGQRRVGLVVKTYPRTLTALAMGPWLLGAVYAALYVAWPVNLALVAVGILVAGGIAQRSGLWAADARRLPWRWLGQDRDGQFWLSAADEPEETTRVAVRVDPATRDGRWGLWLVLRPVPGAIPEPGLGRSAASADVPAIPPLWCPVPAAPLHDAPSGTELAKGRTETPEMTALRELRVRLRWALPDTESLPPAAVLVGVLKRVVRAAVFAPSRALATLRDMGESQSSTTRIVQADAAKPETTAPRSAGGVAVLRNAAESTSAESAAAASTSEPSVIQWHDARGAGDSPGDARALSPELAALLSDDPDHVYSDDELDAIEALDAELALRLDRAQTFARREASDRPADGPIDEADVRAAIDDARRILAQDGGDIEFVRLDGRVAIVRLKGACIGCPRSTLDLKNVVERLVRARAPGVERVANTF